MNTTFLILSKKSCHSPHLQVAWVRGWAVLPGLHSSLLITPRMSTMAELVSLTSLTPAWIVVFTSSHRGFLGRHA